MSQKTFSRVSGTIFALIALLHLLRIVYAWEAVIGGWMVPMWLSWVALVIAGYLGYSAFRLAR